jgi:hypothetical protein
VKAEEATDSDDSRRVMEERPFDPVKNCGSGFTIRLRLDNFREPPRADPHAGWCGEERLITVPYPIMGSLCLTINNKVEKYFLARIVLEVKKTTPAVQYNNNLFI